jgi:hypothetical protein
MNLKKKYSIAKKVPLEKPGKSKRSRTRKGSEPRKNETLKESHRFNLIMLVLCTR